MHNRLLTFVCLAILAWPGVAPAQSRTNHYLGKSAAEWAAELASNDATRRRGAAFALGKCGPRARGFVTDLRAALRDADPTVREAAAFALGEIGAPGALPATKDLVVVLKEDGMAAVRRAAACGLGRLGEAAMEAAPALRDALNDEDPRVRQNAAWALGLLGPEAVGPAAKALVKTLEDADPLVRRDAASALGHGGDKARGAVSALVKSLRDDDPVVRQFAANALGNVGPAASDAIPALNDVLRFRSDDRDLWREAIFAMVKIGGSGPVDAIPAMRKALADKDPLMRKVVANALVNVGQNRPEARQAVPELLQLLGDDDVEVRRNAAAALYTLKEGVVERARLATPVLLKALQNDPDKDVRLFIARTFWDYDLRDRANEETLRVLIKCALNDRERLVRYQLAVMVATHLGPEGKEVTPTLIQFLSDTTITSVEKTTASSSTSGKEDRSGTATVEESGTEDARPVGARALGHIGAAAGPEARRALEEASRDPRSAALREAAAKALLNFK